MAGQRSEVKETSGGRSQKFSFEIPDQRNSISQCQTLFHVWPPTDKNSNDDFLLGEEPSHYSRLWLQAGARLLFEPL